MKFDLIDGKWQVCGIIHCVIKYENLEESILDCYSDELEAEKRMLREELKRIDDVERGGVSFYINSVDVRGERWCTNQK